MDRVTEPPRRPGRPEVGGRVTVSIGTERHDRLKAAARLAGLTDAEMLRRIIDAALAGQQINT